MKGICGYRRLDGQAHAPDPVTRMANALRTTGTGSSAGWQDEAVAMAEASWTPAGVAPPVPAPLHDLASGCVVVADARLDERDALLAALGLTPGGHANLDDRTLILRAWLRWGEACAEHLYGDFVLAVWDPRQRLLYCARDAIGTRPLFVHHAPGRLFAFASSVDALLALPGVPHTLNEGRIADFLVTQLEGIDKTSTFFAEIQRLPPAHCFTLGPAGVRQRRYWALQPWPAASVPKGDDTWGEALTEALERAVGHHVRGSEAVGCMLSGGLDSSSLAVIARDQLAARGIGPLATFSAVDSARDECLETAAIQAMLAQPGFAPSVIDRAAMHGMAEALTQAMLDSAEPFDGNMTLVHAQYLNAAQRGIGAVMDGIDGDTLFLPGAQLVRQLRRGQWLSAMRNARGVERMYPDPSRVVPTILTAARSALVPRALRRVVRAWRKPRDIQGEIDASLISPDFAQRIDLAGRLETLARQRSPYPLASPVEESIEAIDHPFLTVALERYHRVAAYHGIEARHPFADRRLVELCAQQPDRQRFREGWSKPALRHAMRGRLPDTVCWRKDKQHLGSSMNDVLLSRQREAFGRSVLDMREQLLPYLDAGKLDDRVKWFVADGGDEASSDFLEVLPLVTWLTKIHDISRTFK